MKLASKVSQESQNNNTDTTNNKKEDINSRIQKLLSSSNVILFMKGHPDSPQCGGSGNISSMKLDQEKMKDGRPVVVHQFHPWRHHRHIRMCHRRSRHRSDHLQRGDRLKELGRQERTPWHVTHESAGRHHRHLLSIWSIPRPDIYNDLPGKPKNLWRQNTEETHIRQGGEGVIYIVVDGWDEIEHGASCVDVCYQWEEGWHRLHREHAWCLERGRFTYGWVYNICRHHHVDKYSMSTGVIIKGFQGITGSIRSMQLHPVTKALATCGLDRFVRIYNTNTGRVDQKVSRFYNVVDVSWHDQLYTKFMMNCVLFTREGRVRSQHIKAREAMIREDGEVISFFMNVHLTSSSDHGRRSDRRSVWEPARCGI